MNERLVPGKGATGGRFSVCYTVEATGEGDAPAGSVAFLKALDYGWAAGQPDQARALQFMLEAFNFERDVVDHCTAKRMGNVVKGLASGEVNVAGFGAFSRVNYLIFEVADADSRRYLDAMATFDLAWALRALHNVANGIRQLHQHGIVHQDLKPSNVLVFEKDLSKLADLGRASQRGVPAPHDGFSIPGDPVYAPPEQLYGYQLPDSTARRRACDMYHVGSMLLFFFTRMGTTVAIAKVIDPAHWYRQWNDGYPKALPFVRDAFDRAAEMLETEIPVPPRDALMPVFRQLCDPDPEQRGDPKSAPGSIPRYSMERYVSIFDRLAREAEIVLRRTTGS